MDFSLSQSIISFAHEIVCLNSSFRFYVCVCEHFRNEWENTTFMRWLRIRDDKKLIENSTWRWIKKNGHRQTNSNKIFNARTYHNLLFRNESIVYGNCCIARLTRNKKKKIGIFKIMAKWRISLILKEKLVVLKIDERRWTEGTG